ncbi:long-chain fatty acid transport protein [Yoonia maricola]|uniref:Long-chain fatty acid transport protein n=1 Tax=Yoonia maricola TaxID=420999 RepID=A0A2M8WL45_9RHOB|nr:outer membrane protein transport protein [Yoonia maricola]PJI91640.1 long-chain fatty acid transport protein [Yoonia maricola]
MKTLTWRVPALTSGIGALLSAAILPTDLAATNGYNSNGYDSQSKGMSGAGVAVETGVMGLAQNPAFGNEVGNEATACLSFFSPDRGFTFGGTEFESENDLFLIPCLGANFQISPDTTFGVLIYGNGGLNTEYEANPFGGSSPYGVNLEQLFISPSLAYQMNSEWALGIAPVLAFQRFSATGLEPFAGLSTDPTKLTNNGDDFSNGFGINVGALWKPDANWKIGASYRSRINMSAFDEYAGLFAEQGDFDIPPVATIGAAVTLPNAPSVTLTAEYQRIFYGDIPAIANSGALFATALGADDGPGFGWKDMDVVRLGAVVEADEKWTWRSGVSYSTSFIDDDEVLFNTLAPATPQWHASVGADYMFNDRWSVTSSYTRAFEGTVSGANLTPGFDAPVELRMDQHDFTVGVVYNW